MDRSQRLAAAVPRDQRPVADGCKLDACGKQQHRRAGLGKCAFDEGVPRGGAVRAPGRRRHDQVGAIVDNRSRIEARCDDERAVDPSFARRLLEPCASQFDARLGNVCDSRVNADEMRPVSGRKGGGDPQSDVGLFRGVEKANDILVTHSVPSPRPCPSPGPYRAPAISPRAMITRMISFVPSRMRWTRRSRTIFSIP